MVRKSVIVVSMTLLMVSALFFPTVNISTIQAKASSANVAGKSWSITLSYKEVKEMRSNLKHVKTGARITGGILGLFGPYGKAAGFAAGLYKNNTLTDALDKAYYQHKRLKMEYVYGSTMSLNYYKYKVIK